MASLEAHIRRIVYNSDINVITKRMVRREYMLQKGLESLPQEDIIAINQVLNKIVLDLAYLLKPEEHLSNAGSNVKRVVSSKHEVYDAVDIECQTSNSDEKAHRTSEKDEFDVFGRIEIQKEKPLCLKKTGAKYPSHKSIRFFKLIPKKLKKEERQDIQSKNRSKFSPEIKTVSYGNYHKGNSYIKGSPPKTHVWQSNQLDDVDLLTCSSDSEISPAFPLENAPNKKAHQNLVPLKSVNCTGIDDIGLSNESLPASERMVFDEKKTKCRHTYFDSSTDSDESLDNKITQSGTRHQFHSKDGDCAPVKDKAYKESNCFNNVSISSYSACSPSSDIEDSNGLKTCYSFMSCSSPFRKMSVKHDSPQASLKMFNFEHEQLENLYSESHSMNSTRDKLVSVCSSDSLIVSSGLNQPIPNKHDHIQLKNCKPVSCNSSDFGAVFGSSPVEVSDDTSDSDSLLKCRRAKKTSVAFLNSSDSEVVSSPLKNQNLNLDSVGILKKGKHTLNCTTQFQADGEELGCSVIDEVGVNGVQKCRSFRDAISMLLSSTNSFESVPSSNITGDRESNELCNKGAPLVMLSNLCPGKMSGCPGLKRNLNHSITLLPASHFNQISTLDSSPSSSSESLIFKRRKLPMRKLSITSEESDLKLSDEEEQYTIRKSVPKKSCKIKLVRNNDPSVAVIKNVVQSDYHHLDDILGQLESKLLNRRKKVKTQHGLDFTEPLQSEKCAPHRTRNSLGVKEKNLNELSSEGKELLNVSEYNIVQDKEKLSVIHHNKAKKEMANARNKTEQKYEIFYQTSSDSDSCSPQKGKKKKQKNRASKRNINHHQVLSHAFPSIGSAPWNVSWSMKKERKRKTPVLNIGEDVKFSDVMQEAPLYISSTESESLKPRHNYKNKLTKKGMSQGGKSKEKCCGDTSMHDNPLHFFITYSKPLTSESQKKAGNRKMAEEVRKDKKESSNTIACITISDDSDY